MITVRKYFLWFLVNFVFCLLPLFISWLIVHEINDSIFVSFIAFTYTLIITSLYLFEKFRKPESTLAWTTILSSFILFGLYIIYPNLIDDSIRDNIAEHKLLIMVIILLLTIILSFYLNKPAISEDIKRLRSMKAFDKVNQTNKDFNTFHNKLNKE